MIETATMARRHERGCDVISCDFTIAKVRVYLICWEQAARFREPFEHVYAAVKHSRSLGARTGDDRADPLGGVDLRIALEQARAAGLTLAAWNVNAVAAWLCGNQHQEPRLAATDFEVLR